MPREGRLAMSLCDGLLFLVGEARRCSYNIWRLFALTVAALIRY
jgi:hypothetical protein